MTWFDEKLHGSHRQSLKIGTVLYDNKTDHQRLQVFQNPVFGRVLTLDGIVQTTEGDEYIYHEMMAHTPIVAHGSARRVLIIGGGDGGMAREVLRHKAVDQVTMVEIDAGVVKLSKQYLPTLSAGAFEDPRMNLVFADGAEFVDTSKDLFDIIIVDSTDPIGPGEGLFTNKFYADAKGLLNRNGIIVTQNGVPFLQGEELIKTMRAFKTLYQDATCYLATIPTYAGGPMAFGWGTDGEARCVSLAELNERFENTGIKGLRYYTPGVGQAAFVLPEYVSALLP